MTTQQIPMLLFAGGLAGFVNAVAGGGSFITFPALLALGLTPTVANATNNTAMWIGNCGSVSGYWMWKNNAVTLIPAIAVSLAGGLVGANLLLLTPRRRLFGWFPGFLPERRSSSPRVGQSSRALLARRRRV